MNGQSNCFRAGRTFQKSHSRSFFVRRVPDLGKRCWSKPPAAIHTGVQTPDEDIHPAYKKYKTIFELNTSELRKIERDEAHNVDLPDPTPLSLFRYVLGCIKFMLIPRPFRYLWYRIWKWSRSIYYPYHRLLVLKGSKLDYYLQQKADKAPRIDRSLALKRFHWRVSLWGNIKYRSSLIKDILWIKAMKASVGVQQKLRRQTA